MEDGVPELMLGLVGEEGWVSEVIRKSSCKSPGPPSNFRDELVRGPYRNTAKAEDPKIRSGFSKSRHEVHKSFGGPNDAVDAVALPGLDVAEIFFRDLTFIEQQRDGLVSVDGTPGEAVARDPEGLETSKALSGPSDVPLPVPLVVRVRGAVLRFRRRRWWLCVSSAEGPGGGPKPLEAPRLGCLCRAVVLIKGRGRGTGQIRRDNGIAAVGTGTGTNVQDKEDALMPMAQRPGFQYSRN